MQILYIFKNELTPEQRGCLEQLIKAGDLTLLSLLKGY